jgi:glycosyltransferase involved in cell wall biosynthesis
MLLENAKHSGKPVKLCFVGWGSLVHLERWAGYFARSSYHVSVISFSDYIGRYPNGVREYRLGLTKRSMKWKELKMRYLLWKIKPDLVHVHWAGFAHPVARVWSGPLVVTAYGTDIYGLDRQPTHVEQECAIGLRSAHAITCDSEDLKQRIEKFQKDHQRPVYLVQWGVDTASFFPAQPDPVLMSELNVAGRPVIFSPRHITPLYNQKTIVTAFAAVVRQLPDAVLILKHYKKDENYFQILQAYIADLGLEDSVRIVGFLPYERMADLYRMAAVTVSVPLSDATPMSLLEAMACGSVPVVSDLPSLREWVDDGRNGYLVSPQDAEKLALRMLNVLRNPEQARAYVQRNLKIIRERASQDVHMARMADIYSDVMKVSRTAEQQIAGKGDICSFVDRHVKDKT